MGRLWLLFWPASRGRKSCLKTWCCPHPNRPRRVLAVADLQVHAPPAARARARARRIRPPGFPPLGEPSNKNARRAPPGRANAAPARLAQLHLHAVNARRYTSRARAAGPATPAISQAAKTRPQARMQSPRQAWPRPRRPSPGQPVVAYFKRAQGLAPAVRVAQERRRQTYSYLTAGVSTPTQPSLIDDLKASTRTLLLVTLLSPLLLLLIVYHTFADMIAGTLTAFISLLVPAKRIAEEPSPRLKEGTSDRRLVFPGCGCYVFWQLGMTAVSRGEI